MGNSFDDIHAIKWGPMGKKIDSPSNYKRVRLRRHFSKGSIIYLSGERFWLNHIEVQIKTKKGKWKTVGKFRKEDQAVDFLERVVEIMNAIQ